MLNNLSADLSSSDNNKISGYLKISDIIFPESKDWLPVSSFRHLNKASISSVKHLLQEAITSSKGNVLSKFLPGCKGRIVLSQKDNNQTLWYFVVLDNENKHLRTHAPVDASAGWVDADCLK
ncbi:MAG: hypothetical protein ACM34K_11740 [Bacillota bacterium]